MLGHYNVLRQNRKHEKLDNIPVCDNFTRMKNDIQYKILRSQATTGDFYDRGPVYLFSNENIAGYMPALGDMNGANVLTVCASGDHMFEAYLRGAANVDTFDINTLQKCVAELKTHMIRDLDYEQFMDFFFNKKHFFNTRILSPIRRKFSPELAGFIQRYNSIGRHLFRYNASQHSSNDPFKISYVANPNEYYRLRDLLPEKIQFHECDLMDLSEKITQKYDVIMLSNIMDYMYPQSQSMTEKWDWFYKYNLCPLAQNALSPNNGRISFAYHWNMRSDVAWKNFINLFKKDVIHKRYKNTNHDLSLHRIKSMLHNVKWDIVSILHQNQK